ncbi:MAG: hypothetical protein ABJG47_20630 [Ekhidna sp.]
MVKNYPRSYYKKSFVFLTLLLLTFSLHAQDEIPDFNAVPPSPDVAAYNQYIDNEINEFTGTMDVSVPIFTIELENIKVPIGLKYNTQGIKVDAEATSIGTNWSLIGQGSVSRTIRGLPDEINDLSANGQKGFFHNNDLYTNGILDMGKVLACNTSVNIVGPQPYPVTIADEIANGLRDLEPDLFHYSGPMLGGKFLFSHLKDLRKLSANDDQISQQFTTDPTITSNTWTITSNKGIIYKYGTAEKTTSKSICNGLKESFDFSQSTSTWVLDEIIDGNDRVWYEYIDHTISTDKAMVQSKKIPLGLGVNPTQNYCNTNTTINGKLLSKISSSNGYVIDFTYATRTDLPNSKRLETITITRNGLFVSKFKLKNDSYYPGGGKLKLDGVVQLDENGGELPYHSFSYYPGHIPAVGDYSQDYWGFNNDAPNVDLVPLYRDMNYAAGGTANRSPILNATLKGALSDWYFPTGGHVRLTYELNTYYDETGLVEKNYYLELAPNQATGSSPITFNVPASTGLIRSEYLPYDPNSTDPNKTDLGLDFNTEIGLRVVGQTADYDPVAGAGNLDWIEPGDYELYGDNRESVPIWINVKFMVQEAAEKQTGGLRIKSLTYYESGSNLVKKTAYSYSDDTGNSTGRLFSRTDFGENITTYVEGELQSGGLVCEIGQGNTYFNVSAQPTSLFYEGSHVGYSRVSKSNVDFSVFEEPTLGKQVMEFSTYVAPQQLEYPGVFTSREVESGKIIRERIYDSSDGLQKDTEYEYELDVNTASKVSSHRLKRVRDRFCYECVNTVGNSSTNADFKYSYSEFEKEWYRLKKTTSRSYEKGVLLSMETEFGYSAFHHQKEYERITGLNPEGVIQKDYSWDATNRGLLTETTTTLENSQNVQIAGGQFFYEGNRIIRASNYNTESMSFESQKRFRRDADGTVYTQVNRDGTSSVFIWSYGDERRLVGVVSNIPANINFTIGEPEAATKVVLDTFSPSITLYTFLQDIREETSHSIIQSKMEDLRLDLEDEPYDVVEYQYADDSKGWTFSDMIDSNGNKTSYNYDGFGRLSTVVYNGDVLKKYTYQLKETE